MSTPEPWRVLSSRVTYRDRWITLRSDHCATASGREVAPFHVLEYPDWLNVAALTEDGRVVLVREYRHGGGRVMLGLPGGTVDPDDASPEAAARRELAEETGFEGGEWVQIGRYLTNPANLTNTSHLFLALGVRPTATRSLDPTEEIEVVLDDFADLAGRVARHEVEMQLSHAATVNAAALALASGRVAGPSGLADRIRDRLRVF
jgi:8-oxo-dGTP pyrophosphatase MutT (NUDIX family)